MGKKRHLEFETFCHDTFCRSFVVQCSARRDKYEDLHLFWAERRIKATLKKHGFATPDCWWNCQNSRNMNFSHLIDSLVHAGQSAKHNDQLVYTVIEVYLAKPVQISSSRTGSRSEFNRRTTWTETGEPSDLDLRVEGPSGHADGDQGHGLRALIDEACIWVHEWAHYPIRWAACGRGQPAQSKGPCAESPQLVGRTRDAWGCHPKQHSTEDDETCFSTRMQLNIRIVHLLLISTYPCLARCPGLVLQNAFRNSLISTRSMWSLAAISQRSKTGFPTLNFIVYNLCGNRKVTLNRSQRKSPEQLKLLKKLKDEIGNLQSYHDKILHHFENGIVDGFTEEFLVLGGGLYTPVVRDMSVGHLGSIPYWNPNYGILGGVPGKNPNLRVSTMRQWKRGVLKFQKCFNFIAAVPGTSRF